MTYYKIRPSQVNYGCYFIRCSECDAVIKGYTREDVVNKSIEQNWVYDYENDVILCKECRKNKEVIK